MKRLSNKKYLLNKLLWVLVVGWALVFGLMMIGCATPKPVPVDPNPSFCTLWNEGPQKGMEQPFTKAQNRMMHMAYFLAKEEQVHMTMIQQEVGDPGLVDRAMTCYTENIIFLVEAIDDICQCSNEDKKDEANIAWNDYINDCIREAAAHKK